MANRLDQEEQDGKEEFRSKHWLSRVEKVRRYPMVKIRHKTKGTERIERREKFYRGGRAENGVHDRFCDWEFVSEYSSGATEYIEKQPDGGVKTLDEHAAEAFEARQREAKAELESIRDEMRAERRKMEAIQIENRKLEAKIEKDKAETKELLEAVGKPSTASKNRQATARAKKAAAKKAEAKKEEKASTPPVAPPATPVTDVQEPVSGDGVRSM